MNKRRLSFMSSSDSSFRTRSECHIGHKFKRLLFIFEAIETVIFKSLIMFAEKFFKSSLFESFAYFRIFVF